MTPDHLVLHWLAVRKQATAGDMSDLLGTDLEAAERLLKNVVAGGRAVEVDGRYLVSPLGGVALETAYSRYFGQIRENPAFLSSCEAFERINLQLKALITEWQTIEVAGRRVANDHSNKEYDARVIDRLGAFHETAVSVLQGLERSVPRLGLYARLLLRALEKAEDGEIQWISDARIQSYHTVWFELHEDLLRIAGRTRVE